MNPNFEPHMVTKKLLKACEKQVDKYFRGCFGAYDNCLICGGLKSFRDCENCPLAVGKTFTSRFVSCTHDATYIEQGEREHASKEQLLARGNRLIEILDKHGIIIYDKEIEK